MADAGQHARSSKPVQRAPAIGTFVVLLAVLWALNLVDTFQTMFLKESGFLAIEANLVMGIFLNKGTATLFIVKVLALILITSMLVRGWFTRREIVLAGTRYGTDQIRRAIILLLTAGAIYYIIIVALPFILLILTGVLVPPVEQGLP